MSKETAKKNIKSNQTRMLIFILVTLLLNVGWILHVNYLDKATWSWYELIRTLTFWSGQELLALKLLWEAGKPVYTETGALDSCIDLSDPAQLALLSYAQDLLWVCWGIQFLSQFVTKTAWLLYMAVPGYTAYKIWGKFIGPFLEMRRTQREGGGGAEGSGGTAESDMPMDNKSRLERLRQEKKSQQQSRQGKK